jgi:hypothetical protein
MWAMHIPSMARHGARIWRRSLRMTRYPEVGALNWLGASHTPAKSGSHQFARKLIHIVGLRPTPLIFAISRERTNQSKRISIW